MINRLIHRYAHMSCPMHHSRLDRWIVAFIVLGIVLYVMTTTHGRCF